MTSVNSKGCLYQTINNGIFFKQIFLFSESRSFVNLPTEHREGTGSVVGYAGVRGIASIKCRSAVYSREQ